MQQWRKKVPGTLVTLLHPNIVYFQAIILAAYNLQWILKCPLWKWKLQVFSVFISQYPRKTFFFLWKSKTIVLMIQTRWKFFSVRASTIVSKQLLSPQTTDRYSLRASVELRHRSSFHPLVCPCGCWSSHPHWWWRTRSRGAWPPLCPWQAPHTPAQPSWGCSRAWPAAAAADCPTWAPWTVVSGQLDGQTCRWSESWTGVWSL